MNVNLKYNPIKSDEDIKNLYVLADMVWHEYFPCILEKEQIDYMVEMFFSEQAIKDSINQGYEYYFVTLNNDKIGFISIHPEEDKLFLSKLYLTKDNRGKGFSSQMMKFVKSRAKDNNLNKVYLTVNKYNTHTIEVYKHMGFTVHHSDQFDIGKGYIMDDYVMECIL